MRSLRTFAGLLLAMASVAAVAADAASAARGQRLFAARCVLCHGTAADGTGPAAAVLLDGIRPANLRRSVLSDEDKKRIIQAGGAAVGRSPAMPPWGQEFSDSEIGDLLAFLGTVVEAPRPAAGAQP